MAVAADVLRRLCAARELLRERAEPLSIAAVARASGMSPYHFIRRYDAVFGVTPHQARIDARVDRAKHLLASGELSVTEVWLEFTTEPRQTGPVSIAVFSDTCGNLIQLYQPR